MAVQADLSRWVFGPAIGILAAVVGLTAGIRPELAIAASFALAFVIIVIADLIWGLIVFTFLAFLEIVPFGGQALSFSKLLGLLLFISWLMLMTTGREAKVDAAVVRPVAVLLAGLLGWALLSATWAEEPSGAFAVVYRYALNAGFFIIVVTAVRKPRDAAALIIAFVAGAAIAAIYALASPGRFEADFGRLESAALDPNELAAVLVPAFGFCVFAAIGLKSRPGLRLAAVAIGLISALTILLTVSRGGLIALVVLLVAAVLVGGRWRPLLALTTISIAAAGLIYFAGFASPTAVSRLQSTTQGDERVVEGRYTIWQIAWRMAGANPIQGVGGGNFPVASRHYLLQPGSAPRSDLIVNEAVVVHNTYLETLVELGVVGLGLFLALVGFCLASAIKAATAFKRLGNLDMELLSRGLVAALAGILVADFFISEEFSKALWLLLAMGPTMLAIAHRVAGESDSTQSA
jgi:O-antigen ligase